MEVLQKTLGWKKQRKGSGSQIILLKMPWISPYVFIYIYIYRETDLLHLLGILIYLRSFCMNRIKAAEWAFLGLLIPFQKLDIMFCTSDVLACA